MSLQKYKAKRSFKDTPEPVGGKVAKDQLRFVIQKHDASHLHYDFRLEMDGVLKSWAVPKGPSTDPDVKRLAMMVEDHPYDYRTFEGIIPEGNYGAGTVIVWDEGTYTVLDSKGKDKKTQEKELLHQLHSGNLKVALKGKKLRGEFALVKTKGYAENSWLLIKHNDKYASTADITLKDKSVLSKRTLKQVEAHPEKVYGQTKRPAKKGAATPAIPRPKKAAVKKLKDEDDDFAIAALLKDARKSPFPKMGKPMLAMRAEKPFDNKDWIYEIKWDGYRALAFLKEGKVDIRSRNDQPFAEKFGSITAALKNWKVNAVVDGEIIALKENGNADFQALQNFARKGKEATLAYYVFDVLWYNGKDIRHLPLIDRKKVLKSIMPDDDSVIKYSDHIEAKGIAFFNVAKKQGLEGVMAKDANSEYVSGSRTDSWLKVKNDKVMEAIICGFTKPRNSRAHFGAVILGKYINTQLTYIGHSGSGFNDVQLKKLSAMFKPLITEECPFDDVPHTNMPVTWLKPELICDVQFTEWTGDKVLRHPIFKGLREDKSAKNEKNEKMVNPPVKKVIKAKVAAANARVKAEDSKVRKVTKKGTAVKSENKEESVTRSKKTAPVQPVKEDKVAVRKSGKITATKALFQPSEMESTLIIEKQEIKFTNLTKLYWPEEKVTKGDMLNYYHQVAPYILPYLLNRPQSLNRFPEGITGFSFYQKDVDGKVADWLTTHPYFSDSEGVYKKYLVCTGEASLLYTANLGCIEMNPWHSRIQSPDKPDWCVIDLDPDKINSFDQVIEVALVVKDLLDSVKVPSFCKTSGSTGLHIYIPLGAKYSYDQSKLLAELIVNIVHNELAEFTSVERTVSKRKGKIYLDFLQNRTIQTIAAPYSLRPKPGATVSAPLHWSEVRRGLKMAQFNISTMPERLKNEGDLFKGVLGKGINVETTIKRINALL